MLSNLFNKLPLAAMLLAFVTLTGCNQQPAEPASTSEQASAAEQASETAMSETDRANEMFERFFEQAVSRSPQFQTYLGRKTNMDKWNDLSDAFAAESLEIDQQNLAELKTLNVDQLDDSSKLSVELLTQSLENDIEDYQWRLYNYPVNQMFGTHSGVPSLLINQHRIGSVEDAKAYIGRLNNITTYFDQLVDGINARAAANIIPPKFVFPHVIRDSKNIIKGAPYDDGDDSAILADFTKKVASLKDVSEEQQSELISQAKAAMLASVKPAYEKLIATLTELDAKANTDDGVWKWERGDEFYNVALQRTTTTDLTAEEIHNIGLSEVARIHDEMRGIMKQVEFDGDLQAFLKFMREDPQFYYPGTEEGKARYLKEATALIDTMKERLPDLFLTLPKADIQVKAVEAFREQSAGKAFYQRPSEDGSRPGLYYANLYDMEAMPTYQMEALAYHEGVPGHHMQLAIAQELQGIPKFRKFSGYTAYTEGWGLYSEMIPKEIGFYSDPYSDFGRLAMELWRACRLVVDTGIHAMKWTRQEGIDYYVNNTPNAVSDAVKMVERHVVMPSQATAYKIGMLKIVELREKAKEALGDDFDIRAYHDEVIKYGPLPLNVVERKVDAWVASVLASRAPAE